MQNSSQGRRDRSDPKTTPVCEESNIQLNSRDLRAEAHLIDETASSEVMKCFTPGIVTDCLKLNVRETASSDAAVLTIIELLSEVMVDIDASTDDFYKVITAAGVEGFCMRKYIALKR